MSVYKSHAPPFCHIDTGLTDCLVFYTISTVFQLFNGNSSQIHEPGLFFEPVHYPDTGGPVVVLFP